MMILDPCRWACQGKTYSLVQKQDGTCQLVSSASLDPQSLSMATTIKQKQTQEDTSLSVLLSKIEASPW
jgi:hypothetical protein